MARVGCLQPRLPRAAAVVADGVVRDRAGRGGGGGNHVSQVAIQFADLHDTAGRMKEKGVIRAIVEWSNARRYLGARLRRRMLEEAVVKAAARQAPSCSRQRMLALLQEWFLHDVPNGPWDDDHAVSDWLERAEVELRARVQDLEREHVATVILREAEKDKTAAISALVTLMKSLTAADRADLAAKLHAL